MKILIVEDNETLVKALTRVLKTEGYAVEVCVDGSEAQSFWTIHRDAIDLAIVDYMLPGQDGVTLVEEMRGEGVVVPILMLTARDDTRDKVLGLQSGADYYLTKPFEFDELLACLKALLRRPKEYQNNEVELKEDLTFIPGRHMLRRSGGEVMLTRTESCILEYLIKNRGMTVSQENIYEHVFDFAKENWSNTIEVHVKNLRKKLDEKDNESIIKTIRGAGYCLEA